MGRTVMGGGDKRRNINGGNWEEDYRRKDMGGLI